MNDLKKNDKGFTLVELVIVVAIIAILATVLAPQYLQYVERSRESNDLQLATNLIEAVEVAVSDPENNVPPGIELYVVWETDNDQADQKGRVLIGVNNNLSYAGASEFEQNVLNAVGAILPSTSGRTTSAGAWNNLPYIDIGISESAISQVEDLKFSVNTSTGDVTYYGGVSGVTPNDSHWADAFGLTK